MARIWWYWLPRGDHTAMIRLFFATKVWVLKERISLGSMTAPAPLVDGAAPAREIAGEVSAPGGVIFDDGLWFVSHHTGALHRSGRADRQDPAALRVSGGAHLSGSSRRWGHCLHAAVRRAGAGGDGRADLRRVVQRASSPRSFPAAATYRRHAQRARDLRHLPADPDRAAEGWAAAKPHPSEERAAVAAGIRQELERT